MESGRPCVMHIGQITNVVAERCKSCRMDAKGRGAQSWTAANLVGVMEIDKFASLELESADARHTNWRLLEGVTVLAVYII